jgi:hypothetical protein
MEATCIGRVRNLLKNSVLMISWKGVGSIHAGKYCRIHANYISHKFNVVAPFRYGEAPLETRRRPEIPVDVLNKPSRTIKIDKFSTGKTEKCSIY